LQPLAYAFGPDGNLWITSNSNFVTRVTPQGVVTNFPVNGSGPDIVAGPDGNMWFIDGRNTIARMSTAGQVTYFAVPIDPALAELWRLAIGADGNIWFVTINPNTDTYGGSVVGKMTLQGVATLIPYFIDPEQDTGLSGDFQGIGLTAG